MPLIPLPRELAGHGIVAIKLGQLLKIVLEEAVSATADVLANAFACLLKTDFGFSVFLPDSSKELVNQRLARPVLGEKDLLRNPGLDPLLYRMQDMWPSILKSKMRCVTFVSLLPSHMMTFEAFE